MSVVRVRDRDRGRGRCRGGVRTMSVMIATVETVKRGMPIITVSVVSTVWIQVLFRVTTTTTPAIIIKEIITETAIMTISIMIMIAIIIVAMIRIVNHSIPYTMTAARMIMQSTRTTIEPVKRSSQQRQGQGQRQRQSGTGHKLLT